MLSKLLKSYLGRVSEARAATFEALEPRNLLSADLTGSFQPLPDAVGVGAPISVAFDTENVGDSKGKGNAEVKIYLSADGELDEGDLLLATTRAKANLNPGQTAVGKAIKKLSIPGSVVPGEYRLIAVLDGDERVEDADRSNNVIVSEPITITPPDYDLAAELGAIKLDTQQLAGNSKLSKVRAQVLVSKSGDTPLEKSQTLDIQIVARPVDAVDDSQDIIVADVADAKLGALKPGKAKRFNVTTDLSSVPAGNYQLVAIIGSDDLQETDATNNVAATAETFAFEQPEYDLVATFSDPGLPGSLIAGAGDKAKTQLFIENLGNVPLDRSQTIDIAFVARPLGAIDDSQDIVVVEITAAKVGNLAPGKPRRLNVNLEVPPTLPDGNYQLVAVLDTGDELVETDKSNNAFVFPQVYNIAAPFIDLSVNSANQSFNATAVVGDTARGTVTFTNQGNIALNGPVTIEYYVTRTGSQPVRIGQLTTTVKLAVGASIDIRVDLALPPTLDDGATYTFEARLVPGGSIPGDDPSNNQAVPPGEVTVTVPVIPFIEFGGSIKFTSSQSRQGDGVAGIVNREGRYVDGLGNVGSYEYVGGGPLGTVVLAVFPDDPPPFFFKNQINLNFNGNVVGNIGNKTVEFLPSTAGAIGTAQAIGETAPFRIK